MGRAEGDIEDLDVTKSSSSVSLGDELRKQGRSQHHIHIHRMGL